MMDFWGEYEDMFRKPTKAAKQCAEEGCGKPALVDQDLCRCIDCEVEYEAPEISDEVNDICRKAAI